MDHPKNIIVRMPNWIGDFVMATAALTALRKLFPNAVITCMCQDPLGDLLEKDPRIDDILLFRKKTLSPSRRKDRKDLVSTIRMRDYDLGILFTNSFSSAWYFWQARVGKRLGYRGHYRRFLLTETVPFLSKKEHQVLSYLRLISELGAPFEERSPELFVEEQEKEKALSLLKEKGYQDGQFLLGINAFAAYGKAKCWPQEKFRALAEKLLQDKDTFLVFFGDPSCAEMGEKLTEGLGPRVLNLIGKTSLRFLLAAISVCDFFLTNDSGPMHIAAALGVDLLAIFGSTSAVRTGPYGVGSVLQKKVACSPCYRRECPIDFRCMQRISVEEVLAHIQEKKALCGKY